MRQASWNEMFAPRRETTVLPPAVPQEPRGWRRLVWWEDLLTFGLMAVVYLAVVDSVNRANWVEDMPSLYPIAFLGLVMGAALARLRWPEGFIHLLALPVGAAAALGQILLVISGATPWARYEALQERMHDWLTVAFTGGISNDNLPFIVLVVALSWLAAYLSSWAVFRWRNVWLALIPGGTILLSNISYLPDQFSFAFVVFLFGGTLLITRLHLVERAKSWRQDGTPYPPLLSLSVMHATFWLAILLLGAAWLMPRANEASALESAWRRATAPVTDRLGSYGRLFVGLEGQKSVRVHGFGDILPFLGSIELPETVVIDVTTEPQDQPRYLRAQAYDVYTSTGWKQRSTQLSSLEANEITGVDQLLQQREAVTAWITATDHTGDAVFTIGQPRRIDRPVDAQWTRVREDVTSVFATDGLIRSDAYQTVGSVSIATEEELRAAGVDYPSWVEVLYLSLPEDFPTSVRELALGLTRGAVSPYDEALAIQEYLRTIPYDLTVPDTPLGRDAIEYFLFESRRGYFDYHTSAMVVMLRSLGIPSRLAVGYVLDDGSGEGDQARFRVREENAFAWPEVYFPGLGWVEFNPTPGLPAIARPAAVENVPTEPGAGDAPSAELDFDELRELFAEEGGAGAGFAADTGDSSNRNLWIFTGIVTGFAVVLALGAGGVRYAWVRGLGGLEAPDRLWGQAVRLASWGRSPPDPTQTPREYSRSLQEQVPGLEGIDVLADAYVRHRFGGARPEAVDEERLESAWRSVREGLLRRLLRLRQH